MRLDWQSIIVGLIIAGALLYVGRRALARLRSFAKKAKGASSSCETACGSCSSSKEQPLASPQPFVQIKRR